jgi:hypothetical protein
MRPLDVRVTNPSEDGREDKWSGGDAREVDGILDAAPPCLEPCPNPWLPHRLENAQPGR